MREGKTLTRSMQIETRQHELFNLDLGEGTPRRALVAGLLIATAWGLLLFIVLGRPRASTATLWIMPPALITIYGWRESVQNPRRRRVTEWALAIRWITRGHRPVIALGRRAGRPYERTLAQRVAARLGNGDLLGVVMPWRAHAAGHERPEPAARWGRAAVVGGQRVHLTGTDAIDAAMSREQRRTAKRGRQQRTPTSAPALRSSLPASTETQETRS